VKTSTLAQDGDRDWIVEFGISFLPKYGKNEQYLDTIVLLESSVSQKYVTCMCVLCAIP
jgi:hypothetical protein